MISQEIQNELHEILSCEEFKNSNKSKLLLEYLVDETLAGRANEIKQYTIGVKALGYSKDFNPDIDPIVRISVGRIRRKLEHYYFSVAANSKLKIQLNKGSYIPQFLEIDSAENSLSVDYFTETEKIPSASRQKPRILIFELDEVHQCQGYEFFGNGFTEDLIINLSKFKEYEIVGPISKFRLKDTTWKALTKEYSADFALHGTIQCSDQKLKITSKLIELKTVSTIWSKKHYTELNVDEIFKLQEEIAESVTFAVGGLDGAISKETFNKVKIEKPKTLSAYEAVLKATYWFRVFTDEAYNDAVKSLEECVVTCPDYSLPKAILADLYLSDFAYGLDLINNNFTKAKDLVKSAINLDSNCQYARWVNAWLEIINNNNILAKRELEYAYSLNPNNSQMLACYGLYANSFNDTEKALKYSLKAMELNPEHPSWYLFAPSLCYYKLGDYERALDYAKDINIPGIFWEALLPAAILGKLNRKNEAKIYIDKLYNYQPEFNRNGRELMRRLVNSSEYIDLILEGAYQAGMPKLNQHT